MNRLLLIALLCISVAAGNSLASSSNDLADVVAELQKQWPSNRTVNIVCHGHSVPAGYFKTPQVDTFDAYPQLLHRGLAERFPFAVINVIVTAIGGEESESGAKRFERDVLSLHPRVVTIDYGLNDRGIGLARAEAAWRVMITNCLARGIKVILLTPTPDLTAKLDEPDDPLNQHASQIRKLAAEYGVCLVDSLAAFRVKMKTGARIESLMAQSNHPNRAGHELVAAALLRCFSVEPEMKAFSLAGQWRFQLDRADSGEKERWFSKELSGTVRLPGSLSEQGIGDEISTNTPWIGGVKQSPWFTSPEYAKYREPGHIKLPFWLTPDKYYSGAAWYQRDIEGLKGHSNQHVILRLERPHWETRVWVDDRFVGTQRALGTPHEYDLGILAPGKHTLTIRVDNRMIVDIGENSHSISDHTQGDWNGIVGEIALYPRPDVFIHQTDVFPDLANRKLRIRFKLGNASGHTAEMKLNWSIVTKSGATAKEWPDQQKEQKISVPGDGLLVEQMCDIPPDAELWNEFRPALHTLRARLTAVSPNEKSEGEHLAATSQEVVTFGLRQISTQGTQFTVNGNKTFIRGTLDCCIYPKTGHPPLDVESWKRVICVCKAHGLNLLRFHSWCPPEGAFVAADELGFYFQVEASSWANQSTTLGDGKPVDDWIYAETDGILKYYGNHPSFLLMPYGNEPGGKKGSEYLAKWVSHYKALDARRLWTSGSGWPQIPENQFHVTPDPRIQGWGDGLKSRINARPPETQSDYREYIAKRSVPVISHEIGQWCVFPNFDEIKKYTGYLKPKNFEIFRDSLEEHHLGDLARSFLLASGKLQTLCYKEDIESALRTPGMGGFELLDLHDFPGQGTALVGVLDPFWEEKGYVTAAEYSRFCNATVPLARLPKRVFTTDEVLTAELEAAHFGAAALEDAVTRWEIADSAGTVHASGQLPAKTLQLGNGISLGKVTAALKRFPAPAKYRLVARLEGKEHGSREVFENDWDIWVYPAVVKTTLPRGVIVSNELSQAIAAKLDGGGKVLLMLAPDRVRNLEKEPVKLGFSSIFWNTAWTSRQAPTTLGIFCDPRHPLFSRFPTEYHSNWQWWYLISKAAPMIMDDLPVELRPTVQVIDDWVTNHRVGLLFEAKVGKGKLVVCSIDLEHGLENDPVRRQFLESLLHYMSRPAFNPEHTVTIEQVRGLLAKPGGTPLSKPRK